MGGGGVSDGTGRCEECPERWSDEANFQLKYASMEPVEAQREMRRGSCQDGWMAPAVAQVGLR